MDLSQPLALVTPTLDAAVLMELAATTGWLTGGEVHRRAGSGSRDGVRRVLLRLAEQGIVIAQEQSYATLFLLNRDHVGAEAVIALTRVRDEIVNRIRTAIESWAEPARSASLFGSFARGEADSRSDIDILVVRGEPAGDDELWAGQIDALGVDTQRWTGNSAHIVVPSPSTLKQMVAADDPLVRSWRSDQLHLCGANLLDLLGAAR